MTTLIGYIHRIRLAKSRTSHAPWMVAALIQTETSSSGYVPLLATVGRWLHTHVKIHRLRFRIVLNSGIATLTTNSGLFVAACQKRKMSATVQKCIEFLARTYRMASTNAQS